MGVWSKLLKVGVSAGKSTGKSVGGAVLHPSQTLRGAGKAVKTAAVGGAVGYVGWEKLTTDKSVVRIVSDAVVGEQTTDAIAETAGDLKDLKEKAGEAVTTVNNAMTDINSKWSGMSNFFRGLFGGNGLDMFGNFFSNLGSGKVSGLSIAGLVAAAFLLFGRFGWLGKIAGAVLGMMLIGNNANMAQVLSGSTSQAQGQSGARTNSDSSRSRAGRNPNKRHETITK